MSRNVTTKLNDTICSNCYCEDRFLHHVWNGKKGHMICTSCVLFQHKEFFCPTCFDLLVGTEKVFRCVKCQSKTHVSCLSGNEKPDGFVCLTCKSPDRLVFDLHESPKTDNACCKVMDMKAAGLLLTAAKIVKKLVAEAHDKATLSAVIHATETVSAKKKAADAANRFMKFEESNAGPSLIDSSPE